MEWVCPDCKEPETFKVPKPITDGDRVYMVCDKCGVLLYIDCKRSKMLAGVVPDRERSVWGIPRK